MPMWNASGSPGAALAAARASAEKALQLDPDNAEGYMVRGMAAYFGNDVNAASADLDRALALAPGSVDVLNMDGDFRLSVGDLAAAERDKRRAMALDPLAFVHPLNLSDGLVAQGRYAEAAILAEQSVALGAREFGYLRMVFAYSRLGRLDDAKAAMEKGCAINPSSVGTCILNRVQWLAASGQQKQAKALLDDVAQRSRNGQLKPGGYDAALMAAFYYEVGDIPASAQWQRIALDDGSWYLTAALTGAPGGAKLPEEISRDRDWLAVWADPRMQDVMTVYRRNLLAWRACAKGAGGCR
jgi:tetratricopeptide (TPR) repeat protein